MVPELPGMPRLFGGRNVELGYDVTYLGQRDANPGNPFDARRVGLDHRNFDVESREELDGRLARLDACDIPHSGNTEEQMGDVLAFCRPDNVQFELIYLEPEAIEQITATTTAQHSTVAVSIRKLPLLAFSARIGHPRLA